jgi:hypothetical protein
MLGNVRDVYGKPANFASLLPEYQRSQAPGFAGLDGSLQYSGGPFDRAGMEDALYNRSMRFTEPRLQQEESRLHQRLVSQGFNTNDDAYQEQMRLLREGQGQQRADAADRAMIGSDQMASSELARIMQARQGAQGERRDQFSTGLQSGQFGQEDQRLALAAALQKAGLMGQDRARALNELNAFNTGTQIQLPGTQAQFGTPNLQTPDYIGAANQAYQNQLGQYNARTARNSNFYNGLFDLFGSIWG